MTSVLPQELILSSVSLPKLSSLFLGSYPELADDKLPFHQFSRLRQLVHVSQGVIHPFTPKTSNAERFDRLIFEAAQASASSLLRLHIPGHFAQFQRMASLSLTSLQTLELRGCIYPQRSIPFRTILAATPQLSELVLELLVMGDPTGHFAVDPDDSIATPVDLSSSFLPKLRRLTLANPDPTDRVFQQLTMETTFLSLPAVVFKVPERSLLKRSELALSSSASWDILQRCNASGLTEFRISISGELPPALLVRIAEAFPLLEKFELRHRLRLDQKGDPVMEKEYSPVRQYFALNIEAVYV